MWKGEAQYAADGSFFETEYCGAPKSRPAREVLEEFAASSQWQSPLIGSNSLPRGLNSAVRREIVEEVRAKYGRAYAALSPDYTSAFHQLAAAERQVELDFPFYVGHSEASNGASSIRNGVAAYAAQVLVDPFEGCPLPLDTVVNSTIRDYLWVSRITGGGLPPVDPVGYLLINYRELQIKRELGSRLDVAGMRRAVLSAAASLNPGQQAVFAAGRAIIDARDTPAFRLRSMLARTGGLRLAKRAVNAARLGGRQSHRRYHDVLEAARAVPLRRLP
jgi:hypothetical protein